MSGPAVAQFADSSLANSSVSFPVAGDYELQLSASDGELSASDTMLVTVAEPDLDAPTVPANLTVVAGTGQATVSWDASSDATGVAAYRLYRDGSLLVELNALSHVDINLVALNEYSYSIAAVDLAGNISAQSVAVVVIMPEVPTETFSLDVRITTGVTLI
ncbi:MAG: hypothetical protein GY822_15085 [Deltaproteobacteria bacterium]|nr:hypothetical protein [Deltaproteobacteria bacterium]